MGATAFTGGDVEIEITGKGAAFAIEGRKVTIEIEPVVVVEAERVTVEMPRTKNPDFRWGA